jgi:hypothetical protein
MTAQEYIITGLNNLIDTFQNITFKYKFDNIDNTHVILVEPLKEFEENKEYLIAESGFVYFFEKTFIQDTILFVSTDSLIKVDAPDLVFSSNLRGLFINEMFVPTYNFSPELMGIAGESSYALAA